MVKLSLASLVMKAYSVNPRYNDNIFVQKMLHQNEIAVAKKSLISRICKVVLALISHRTYFFYIC